MRQDAPRRWCKTLLSLILVMGMVCPGTMAVPLYVSDPTEEVEIMKGDVYMISSKKLQRVSVSDPQIADVSEAKSDKVAVIGKAPGKTTVFVWDEHGKKSVMIHVFEEDLASLKIRIQTLLESAAIPLLANVWIQENRNEGKIVLSGALPEEQLEVLNKIVQPFSKDVINLVQKGVNEDLIQIDAQVTELNTTLAKEIGVNWNSPVATIAERETDARDFFKIGSFARTSTILATVNALIEEGRARILSKPRLVVFNGKEARLLVGGEIPVKTATTLTETGTTTTYAYKEYGVTLLITPTIRNGRVDIVMNVEIRDLDKANALEGNVAFLTRTAQTRLFLDNRQTIVLAGMIRKSVSEGTTRVAGLSKIPILGLLFRNNKISPASEDREVVISLTPTIIASNAAPLAQPKEAPDMIGASVPQELLSDGGRNAQDLPVISKNIATTAIKVPGGVQEYAASVQQKISEAVAFPQEAKENGWQGTAKIGLVIRRDGSLKDAFIQESSGYEVLDKDAVNTAYSVAPFPPFSEDMLDDKISIDLPIVYSTDKFLQNVVSRH